MSQTTFKGRYGIFNTPCIVLYYAGWHCVKGGYNVNYTNQDLYDGIDVEEIHDLECSQSPKKINTFNQLVKYVNS